MNSQNYRFLVVAFSLTILLCGNNLIRAEPDGDVVVSNSLGLAGAPALASGMGGGMAVETSGNGSTTFSTSGNMKAVGVNGNSGIFTSSDRPSVGISSSGGSASSNDMSSGQATNRPDIVNKIKEVLTNIVKEEKGSPGVAVDHQSGPQGSVTSISTPFGRASGSVSTSNSPNGAAAVATSSNSGESRSGLLSGLKPSTPKPGLLDKLSDTFKRGKENMKEKFQEKKEEFKEKKAEVQGKMEAKKDQYKEKKEEFKQDLGLKQRDEKKEMEKKHETPMEKLSNMVAHGADTLTGAVNKLEDKASNAVGKVRQKVDENVLDPMRNVEGSGHTPQGEGKMGKMAPHAAAVHQIEKSESDYNKYLLANKHRQEAELGRQPTVREVLDDARNKGVIPQNQDKSSMPGYRPADRSVTVEVLDRAHEISKIPLEKALKPVDNLVGFEKDPLIRQYDDLHDWLVHKPLEKVAKPIEGLFTGAFKTTEESKREHDKWMEVSLSEEARKAERAKEERERSANRSIAGDIADKTLELYEKPIEIILKPLDHMFGLDKKGMKNPVLKTLDDIYRLSKKPVDAIAKPFEKILKKMGEGEQYEVAIRYDSKDSSANSDPKLFTRLADGALNVADRAIVKPLQAIFGPLEHLMGYDDVQRPGAKNPVLTSFHRLKNATRVGVELFTKPLDRIIKEISEIGEIKDEAERDAEYARKREEASRIVRALDKLHELIQQPFEIVLKPVGRALGITKKKDEKQPILRAWDVVHQVVRTPIQVISKPIEDAIFGEQPRKYKVHAVNQGRNGKGPSSYQSGGYEAKKNFFVDKIKKAEKAVVKPIEVITAPIRQVILGEDYEKTGNDIDKNNREIQAMQNGSVQKRYKNPDEIVRTLEKMNNVLLRPLELLTQPISDVIAPEKKRDRTEEKRSQKEGLLYQHPQPSPSLQKSPQSPPASASTAATAATQARAH